MKNKVFLILAAVLLAGLVGFRIHAKLALEEAVAARAEQVSVPSVEVASPASRPLQADIHVTGTLRPDAEVDVVSKAVGRVVEVKTKLGDHVRAGQVLALVEQDVAVIQLRQANAGLEAAQAGLANAEASARGAETLGQTKNIADVQLVAARSGLAAAKAQVKQAQAAVALARENLENTRVKSPIDGVITRKGVTVGAMVGASPMPLFRVEDLAHLRLEVALEEREATRVRAGQAASFTVDAWPGERFAGVVEAMAPSLDASSRRAQVEIAVDNADGRLFGNTFAEGRIEMGGGGAASLALPRSALVGTEAEPAVFVVEGDVARLRPVKVGASDGLYVAIEGGVSAGDAVIVTGQTLVRDGDAVAVRGAPAAAGQ